MSYIYNYPYKAQKPLKIENTAILEVMKMDDIIKAIAYYSEGLEGIYILNVVHGIDDCIVWKYSTNDYIHKTRIYYDRKGDPYFKAYSRKVYLRDCLRTDI